MLTSIIATLLLVQGQAGSGNQGGAEVKESASQIVSKMLDRYAKAKSVSGIITLRQRALNTEIKVDTHLQFDRPELIYINQIKHRTSESPESSRILSSNGKTFSYASPPGVFGKPRTITEAVAQNGIRLTITDMYAPYRQGLEDPNPMLEVAISRRSDLEAFMGQLASMTVYGTVKLGDRDVVALTGDHRVIPGAAATGVYEMYISDKYDFVKFVLKQKFAVPDKPNQVVEVTSIWDSTLTIDAKTDPKLYKG